LRALATKRKVIEAQIAMLRAEADAETAEFDSTVAQEALQENVARRSSDQLALLRGGVHDGKGLNPRK
jgi:hypothetical protein